MQGMRTVVAVRINADESSVMNLLIVNNKRL